MLISAAAAAGWVASPLIKYMFGKVEEYLSGQFKFTSRINDDLRKLYGRLDETLLALSAVKGPAVLDEAQLKVFRKLTDLAEAAEEILDEFDYIVLKQLVDQKHIIKHIASSSKSTSKRVFGLDPMKDKLHKMIKLTEDMREKAQMFVSVMSGSGTSHSSYIIQEMDRARTTVCSHRGLIGRQKEIDFLIGELIQRKSNTVKPLVVSIVGNGGIGKTALAQLIYRDENIMSHFDIRIWISLSGTLDELKYTKQILKSIDESLNLDDMNLNQLQDILQKKLDDKKLLLILDDIWHVEVLSDYVNMERWITFLEPLGRRNGQTMILVTTRMVLVAEVLNSVAICKLEALCNEDSISLFEVSAFGDENPELYPVLRDLGRRYVRRLDGYPLAIKVVGSLLYGQLSCEVWKEILEIDLTKEQNIISVLRLSYDRLPLHLQKCFAYCSLFPKNFIFDPQVLTGYWIAQRYVEVANSEGIERTASKYFNQLVARSFFQPIETQDLKLQYMMHDHLNDLAVYLTMGEFLRIEDQLCPQIPCTVRHLFITDAALSSLKDKQVLRRLKSLIVYPYHSAVNNTDISHDRSTKNHRFALKNLRSARALTLLYHTECKVPNVFSKCVHLRFLWMHNTAETLPKCIERLYHLQIIRVSMLQPSSVTFPRGIKNLKNILSILAVDCIINVKGGRHPAFKTMLGYIFSESWAGFGCESNLKCIPKENGCWKVDWIKDMDQLYGLLAIVIPQNISSIDEALKLNLERKKNETLVLEWLPSKKQFSSHAMLAALKPSHILRSLFIKSYPGKQFPSWLGMQMFEKLSRIVLSDCTQCEVIPCFGDLPSLKSLCVYNMPALKIIEPEFFGRKGFPSLVRMFLYDFPELEEICCPDDLEDAFPELTSFELRCFQKLAKVPFWHQFRWRCTVSNCTTSWSMDPLEQQAYEFDEIMVLPLDYSNTQLDKIQSMNKIIINEGASQEEEISYTCFYA